MLTVQRLPRLEPSLLIPLVQLSAAPLKSVAKSLHLQVHGTLTLSQLTHINGSAVIQLERHAPILVPPLLILTLSRLLTLTARSVQ